MKVWKKKELVLGIIVLFIGVGIQPVMANSDYFNSETKQKTDDIKSSSIIIPDGPDLRIMNMELTFWRRSYYDPVLQTIKCDIKNVGTVNISHFKVDSNATLIFPFTQELYYGWARWAGPDYWPPGETKNEVLFQFNFHNKKKNRFMRYFPCIYFIHIEIICNDDINPDNNIIEGRFLVWYKRIIEVK
jgi:hypothetical protein